MYVTERAGSRGRGEADAGRGEEGKQTERRRGGVGGGVARRRICTGREREVRREMHVRKERSKARERDLPGSVDGVGGTRRRRARRRREREKERENRLRLQKEKWGSWVAIWFLKTFTDDFIVAK